MQVERQGISHLSAEAACSVVAAGRRLKLICRAEWVDGKVRAGGAPEEIAADHAFAQVSGKGAALRLETDMMGPLWIMQEDPGLNDTAAGVLQDLLRVASGR